MFKGSSKYYDLIYSWKDYKSESSKITDFIKERHPQATTVLDVACGTHEHAKYLTQFRIDGLDINQDFLDIAHTKNTTGSYYQGDMTDFHLGKTYDVVMCLFSSIGYVLTEGNVHKAIACFYRHTSPGGIILVEPWFTPDQWALGKLHMTPVDNSDVKICRMNISEMRGKNSYLKFHYLLGTKAGVEYFTEEHELGLFTKRQMKEAFTANQLEVEFDAEGLLGRGLYIGKKPG